MTVDTLIAAVTEWQAAHQAVAALDEHAPRALFDAAFDRMRQAATALRAVDLTALHGVTLVSPPTLACCPYPTSARIHNDAGLEGYHLPIYAQPVDLTQSIDSVAWAQAFMRRTGGTVDEGRAIAWFAFAIMAGWDRRNQREVAQ